MPRAKALTPDGLTGALRGASPAPAYLVFGEEDLLVDEIVDALVGAARGGAPRDFNLDVVRGNDAEAKHVVALASAFPMMGERRAVVVRDCDRLADREILLAYLQRTSPTTLLVLTSGKPDFRTSFFKSVEDHAVLVECRQLYDNEVPAWIRRRVEAAGKSITAEACELMPAYAGRSLRELQQEIEKLLIFAGDRGDLTADDVTAVVGASRQYNIFELQNAIGARDLARALSILESMMRSGEQPTGILVMLTKYVQKLFLIRSYAADGMNHEQIGAVMRVSPKQSRFFGQDAASSRRFNIAELEAGFEALAQADEQLKSTSLEPRLVMTLLVHSLAHGAGAA